MVIVKELNLSSLASVRKFAEDINATEEKLNILINNAGKSCLCCDFLVILLQTFVKLQE